MTAPTVMIQRVHAGQVEALFVPSRSQPAPPDLALMRGDETLAPVQVLPARDDGAIPLRAAIPAAVITDGVTVLSIQVAGSTDVLAHVTLVAGDALAEDLVAEVALLRAELDLLKAAVRRQARS